MSRSQTDQQEAGAVWWRSVDFALWGAFMAGFCLASFLLIQDVKALFHGLESFFSSPDGVAFCRQVIEGK